MARKIAFFWGHIAEYCDFTPYEFNRQQLMPSIIVLLVLGGAHWYCQGGLFISILVVVYSVASVLAYSKVIISYLCLKLTETLVDNYIDAGLELHLNGYQAWDYYEKDVFGRMGHHIGHGLCYESSALMMMLIADSCKTRLVFGESYSGFSHEMVDHCWVELKYLGIWWVIDSSWCSLLMPIPRILYNLSIAPIRERIVSCEEFWGSKITKVFYEALKTPDKSYLFHELVFFRRTIGMDGRDDCMIQEILGDDFLDDFEGFGERSIMVKPDIFSSNRPITQRIINEYMAKESRERPKAHTIRKAKRDLRFLQKARDEYAREHPEEATL